MAALIRHVSFANASKSTSRVALAAATMVGHRLDIVHHSSIVKLKKKLEMRDKMRAKARIDSAGVSLAARGFLRSQKSYQPSKDVSERIDQICAGQSISARDDMELRDPVLRFKLLVACEEELKHSIPNSLLYTIEKIGDLRQFYLTPVDSTTPYEALRKIELPKNLHIQQDYHRFHPDTDTMFNGKTAFPKSSTLVTGLKYKKKYPGHMQEDPYLEEQLRI